MRGPNKSDMLGVNCKVLCREGRTAMTEISLSILEFPFGPLPLGPMPIPLPLALLSSSCRDQLAIPISPTFSTSANAKLPTRSSSNSSTVSAEGLNCRPEPEAHEEVGVRLDWNAAYADGVEKDDSKNHVVSDRFEWEKWDALVRVILRERNVARDFMMMSFDYYERQSFSIVRRV